MQCMASHCTRVAKPNNWLAPPVWDNGERCPIPLWGSPQTPNKDNTSKITSATLLLLPTANVQGGSKHTACWMSVPPQAARR
jgi:hypothetical protein